MRYSKGIFWLDDCRIPILDEKILVKSYSSNAMDVWYSKDKGTRLPDIIKTEGRFTPNLLVCDDMLNDGIEHISGKVKPHHKRNKTMGEYQGNAYGKFNNVSPDLNYDAYYGDKGSSSRYYNLDLWFDNMINKL